MKKTIPFIALLFLVGFSMISQAQSKNQSVLIKDGNDTVTDFTNSPNKGFIGFLPIHMQPGFNGLLNYGLGAHFAFSFPKWATVRGKAVINLYEQDRSLWEEKVYDNWDEVQKGYWFEGGIDLNLFDYMGKATGTILDSTGKMENREGTERTAQNGTYKDESTTYIQTLYGKYYDENVFLYKPAIRIGAMQYRFTYVDGANTATNNVLINGFYGGFGFSKIGLGKPTFFTLFADAMYKASIKMPTDANSQYLSKSVANQLGFRVGAIGGSNWLCGVGEIGMAPGLDKLEFFIKAGLAVNLNLTPKRIKRKAVDTKEEEDLPKE